MLPNQQLFQQIQQQILNFPNQRKESKRRVHFCLFLLGWKAGLRVSEAINFNLSNKTRHGLYRITKTKGKKERYVAIPHSVISELKKHNWQPNQTNRFNFYHFLKSIKNRLGIPPKIALTPHTLRRSFATYHAENGLSMPVLQQLLGHSSIRTTALYWMNTYWDDDDDSDSGAILVGKEWLENEENEPKQPNSELPIKEISPNSELLNQLRENLWNEQEINQFLSSDLSNYQQKIAKLEKEKATLQADLSYLDRQNNILEQENAQITMENHQIQQDLTTKNQDLQEQLTKLVTEKQVITNLHQQLKTEQENNQSFRENNANLSKKLIDQEKTITELQKALNNQQISLNQLISEQTQNQQKDQVITNLKKENQQLTIRLKQLELSQLLNYYLNKGDHLKSQKALTIQLTKAEIQAILDKKAEINQLISQISPENQLKAQIQVNYWKPPK